LGPSQIEVALHPVRMQILQTLTAGRRLTPGQMAERLPHVAQATLYRQINRLLEAGLIHVVEDRQVRGTTERVYALAAGGSLLSTADAGRITPEEHLRLFMTYTTGLINRFAEYIRQPGANVAKDWVRYRQAQLHLTEVEYRSFMDAFLELAERYAAHEPGPGRRTVTFASMVIPDAVPGGQQTTPLDTVTAKEDA